MVTLLKRDFPRLVKTPVFIVFRRPLGKGQPGRNNIGKRSILAATPIDPSHSAGNGSESSVDDEEIARFEAMADKWWDPEGDFKPLHRLNPVRVGYLRDKVTAHFGSDENAPTPFAGLRILDIGCGGGLLAEPMARLGAQVVGADAGEANIRVARLHAARAGLDIDYRHTTAEALAEAGEKFDVIVNMEVIEHVADVGVFLGACAALLASGGAMAISTLNRTPKSYVAAIIGAEYLLRWLPRGTHNWRKFVKPSELADALAHAGLRLSDIRGLEYNPFGQTWSLGRDTGVNYVGFAVHAGSEN
ncbi:MAG: bifunctional 2-polyprenyl-6-hydroxyphenol methylase/3-demethylubiquinol 3-O-methyltransferase UbiG [Proteobacteria bacterium]|nr:bifunctional 2-polyprenyl-6-hydroxyphenol methylase/3-demethylubiquinol 3-O-methyltransferase UbiG [Pseudomonadota bacterium]